MGSIFQTASLFLFNNAARTLGVYILDLISSNSFFSLSMSVGCCGHPIVKPSSSFGLGICLHQYQAQS
jgi:hypothetical protein